MTYEPTNWQRGDIVSSERLNKMEAGIAASDGAMETAKEDGGIGYYDKTTLLNETIPVADWVDETTDAYAEIDVTGIELSADKKYWIVIDGVATECDYAEEDNEWYISPVDETTLFPAISTNGSNNYSLFLAELPTEPVSFQLIEGEAQKISNDFIQASGGGAFIVTEDDGTLDKTWQEIKDAYDAGQVVIVKKQDESEGFTRYLSMYLLDFAFVEGDGYMVTFACNLQTTASVDGYLYIAETADSYPGFYT